MNTEIDPNEIYGYECDLLRMDWEAAYAVTLAIRDAARAGDFQALPGLAAALTALNASEFEPYEEGEE